MKSIIEKSIDIGVQNKISYDQWLAGAENVSWCDDNGSYLQFGGIDIRYDLTKDYGNRLISAVVNGEELADEKLYTIATNNYIAL